MAIVIYSTLCGPLTPLAKHMIFYFLFSRFVSAPALLAMGSLGNPSVALDSADCRNLVNLGDHLMTQARADTLPSRRYMLPLAYRVPPTFRHALAQAYARVHLLDDYCLVLAELNETIPQLYRDEAKTHQAMMLLPGQELIDLNRDQASKWNALSRQNQLNQRGHLNFPGQFGPFDPFLQF